MSAVTSNCPVIVSLEDHSLTVLATDGREVQPQEVTSLTISNGERYDFLVSTLDHSRRTYRMEFSGTPGPYPECAGLSALALVQYGRSAVDQAQVQSFFDTSSYNYPYPYSGA